MQKIAELISTALLWIFISFPPRVFCMQPVACRWGSFGTWSECDPCTKLQTRSRPMVVYAQFGGGPCSGPRSETSSCETTQGCPLEDGCGDRFRCQSGRCISKSLLCNGDQDCEGDGLDERVCDAKTFVACPGQAPPPPDIEKLGLGFDVVTEKTRGSVINTNSFGGQCRTVYSGNHNNVYRLPLSVLQYNFLVTVKNDFSGEMFSSKWHYAKDKVEREKVTGTTSGFRNYDFHETRDITQTQKLTVLKNDIELAQFQSTSPKYLPIAEEFWKALAKLPLVYDYSAYRKILERFGTHYISEGSLGGSFKAVISINEATDKYLARETQVHHECSRTKHWVLFFPITREDCIDDNFDRPKKSDAASQNHIEKVHVEGGGVSHIAALQRVNLDDPNANWEIYSNWAESVRSFPGVIKQKLQPISELVKEVQCSGVKRLYLRRAIEQYLEENDACHCQPCRNNGMVMRDGDVCKCICKAGTTGPACENGAEVEGQQGVISGGWSCWSAWSSCSGGRRSRSRSCSNPYPQNGGQHCIGDQTQTSGCDDEEELQYLKTMEPQCFDISLPARQKCDTPPSLVNGYILNPKDSYFVGDKVEYTCTPGFYLLPHGIIECTASQTWSASPGLCAVSVCRLPSLVKDVIVTPLQESYHLGEVITLSCPEGKELEGEQTSRCDSSLHFSPDPAQIRCTQVQTAKKPVTPALQCQTWEKPSRGRCVCKMPNDCSPSLELCATAPNGKFVPMTVCKMHAIKCIGGQLQISEYNNCMWPQRNTTGCHNCLMWEDCDVERNQCSCKDSANCSTPGSNVCVRVGEDVTALPQSMSECEAGLRRCKGEKVSVINILPCDS
nr:complement component C7 [Nothobranchius furzeri]